MDNDAGIKVLDARLANVEAAIMEMKESQNKIGNALTELVKLASRHEEHRVYIAKRLDQLDELEDRLRQAEVVQGQLKLVQRGVLSAVGAVLAAVFAFIWNTVTSQGF